MNDSTVHRAECYEDLLPLIELVKAGKLFAVQKWMAEGKPVNGPEVPIKGNRRKTPLEYAIQSGFHSMVEVMVDGGALIEEFSPVGDLRFCALNKAIQERRLDMVKALVARGANPSKAEMEMVFDAWDPEMMRYFIEQGAEVEEGNPLAYALTCRIRTAVGILKGYRKKFSAFQEQGDIALRHHSYQGNLKWVSLLLWAGADPYSRGKDDYEDSYEPDPDDPESEGCSALELAALGGHYDVFDLPQLRLDISKKGFAGVLRWSNQPGGPELVERLLKKGLNLNDQPNGGCSAISQILGSLDYDSTDFSFYSNRKHEIRDKDCGKTRRSLEVIQLLLENGARWIPKDREEMNWVRRNLIRMKADYTVKLVD